MSNSMQAAILGTAWVTAVFGAWIWLGVWLAASGMLGVPGVAIYFTMGFILPGILAIVPFFIYGVMEDQ